MSRRVLKPPPDELVEVGESTVMLKSFDFSAEEAGTVDGVEAAVPSGAREKAIGEKPLAQT